MTAHRFKLELAGRIMYGAAFETEAELEAFIAIRAVDLGGSAAVPADPRGDEQRFRGRPSRNEEIAAAIDALDDELDRCGSIKSQARAVRTYLEQQGLDGDPPGLSTIETYISVYRRPRTPSALKIAQKIKRG